MADPVTFSEPVDPSELAQPTSSAPTEKVTFSEPVDPTDLGPGLAQRIVNAGNKGLVGLEDFADPLAPLSRLLRKGARAAGIDVGPDETHEQAWEKAGLVSNDPSFAPQSVPERYAQSAAEAAGSNLVPALFTLGGSAAPAAGRIIASELGAAGGQGVGGQAARDEFPGNPYADIVGQVLGGLGGGLATHLATGSLEPKAPPSEIKPIDGEIVEPTTGIKAPAVNADGAPFVGWGDDNGKPYPEYGTPGETPSVTPVEASPEPVKKPGGAGLVVAMRTADGEILKGSPGSNHSDVFSDNFGKVKWSGKPEDEGFVTPDGTYLDRQQAADWVNSQRPTDPVDITHPNGLESNEYRRVAGADTPVDEPAEPLAEMPAKVGNLNTDKLGLTLEDHPFLAQAVKDVKLDPQTHADTIQQALEMKNEMSPEELVTFDPLKSEQVAHSVALRAQLNEAVSRATKAAQAMADPATNTPAVQAEFDEAMNLAGITGTAASEGSKFAGQLLNSHGIKVGPDGKYAKGIAAMAGNYTQDMRNEMAQKVLYYKGDPEQLQKYLTRQTIKNNILNALNLPRSMMSTLDLSAPFRQGLGLIGRKEFWTSFGSMFRQFGSERAFKEVQNSIVKSNMYPLMQKAGLYIAKSNDNVTAREEAFMSSYAEKIPLIGKAVRASDRAYTGFLNKLRADTFTSIVSDAEKAGIDIASDSKKLTDLGKFINNATGRGDLGSLEGAAPALSAMFFSPRLIKSRVNTLNPMYYIKLDPMIRKEALKSLLAMGGVTAGVLGLAKAGGMSVETDPRSSDFAKIKDGNTRYDITGGYSPYIRLATAFATNQKKTQGGEIKKYGAKYGDPTLYDALGTFVRTKFAPIPGAALDLRLGKDVVGQPVTPSKEVLKMFIPMVLQDMQDVYADQGAKGVAKAVVPSVFGVGVQNYAPHQKKTKEVTFSEPK